MSEPMFWITVIVTVASFIAGRFHGKHKTKQLNKSAVNVEEAQEAFMVHMDSSEERLSSLTMIACLGYPTAFAAMEPAVEPFIRAYLGSFIDRKNVRRWAMFEKVCCHFAYYTDVSHERNSDFINLSIDEARRRFGEDIPTDLITPILDTTHFKNTFRSIHSMSKTMPMLLRGYRPALIMPRERFVAYLRFIGVSEERIAVELQHPSWSRTAVAISSAPLSANEVIRQLGDSWSEIDGRIREQISRARIVLDDLPLERKQEIAKQIDALEARLTAARANRTLPNAVEALSEADNMLVGLEVLNDVTK